MKMKPDVHSLLCVHVTHEEISDYNPQWHYFITIYTFCLYTVIIKNADKNLEKNCTINFCRSGFKVQQDDVVLEQIAHYFSS